MKLIIPIATFSDNAVVTNHKARFVTLSETAAADIINHALQLILADNNNLDTSHIMDELADALRAYDIYRD